MSSTAILVLSVIALFFLRGSEASKCPTNWNVSMGSCRNLNATSYQGIWYEQARSSSFVFDWGCYCTTANYTIDTLPAYVGVHNRCDKGKVGGDSSGSDGKAALVSAQLCGLSVSFFGPPGTDVNYQVFDTDYGRFSIVVTCGGTISRDLSLDSIWILSRTKVMDPQLLQSIIDRLSNMGFDFSDKVLTAQGTGCIGQGY